MRPWTNKSVGLGLLGLVLIIAGTSMYFFRPIIFHRVLQKIMPLSPTSKSFEVWKDTSSLPPMYLKIHFFNWTNPHELLVKGTKPILEEVGPYVFQEIRQKSNVMFHSENNTVSYFYKKWWYFVPEMTNGSLSDLITQLDAVHISAKHKVRYRDTMLQTTLSFLLTSSTVHTTKTVSELLFEGYDDSLINLGRLVNMEEDIPPFDKFGWFYMRNGSTMLDGHFNMDTGAADISQLGVLKKWNYKDTTNFFKSPCNIVEGSAGEFWSPYRQKDEIVLFSGDLCRPLTYEYTDTIQYHGVEGYRYVLSEKSLGNDTRRRYPHDQAKFFESTTIAEDFFEAEHSAEATNSPDEDPDIVNIGNCYCNGKCTPVGMMNVSACRYGAPVFASLPHFHRADPSLREAVIGMNPDEEMHDFSITLEPTTGIPLKVSARLQVNVLLEPSKIVTPYKDVPTIYFPVFWFTLDVEATPKFVGNLNALLFMPDVLTYISAIPVVIGTLTIFTVVLLSLLSRQKANSVPSDKVTKPRLIVSPGNKSELMYLDTNEATDDTNSRQDRRLYPASIECFNMDLQSKLRQQK